MAGIADVARLAGVSQATASRALTGRGSVSDATRARVVDAARVLDYVASSTAASLVTGRTHAVGVVVPTIGSWYFSEVVEGIHGALLEHGYDLSLYDASPHTPARAAIFERLLARRRFDGLIAVGIEPEHHELARLLSLGKPVVTIGSPEASASGVTLDNHELTRRATEHLLELGHRRIALLGGTLDGRETSVGDQERIHGYLDTMERAGLAAAARHIRSAVSVKGGYSAGAAVLGDSRDRPTAVVGICDEVAIGAIIAARRMGILVPADLSVIGIDDHENAEMFALTTFAQRPREQGQQATALLLGAIADPGAPIARVFEPATLIVRASTSAISPEHSAVVAGTRPRP